jgi:hypothetical protein
MRRLQQQFFMLGPPDWLKMKNAAAPAVKREAARSISGEARGGRGLGQMTTLRTHFTFRPSA